MYWHRPCAHHFSYCFLCPTADSLLSSLSECTWWREGKSAKMGGKKFFQTSLPNYPLEMFPMLHCVPSPEKSLTFRNSRGAGGGGESSARDDSQKEMQEIFPVPCSSLAPVQQLKYEWATGFQIHRSLKRLTLAQSCLGILSNSQRNQVVYKLIANKKISFVVLK